MTRAPEPLVTETDQPSLMLDLYPGDEGLAQLAALIEALTLVADEGIDIATVADLASTTADRIDAALRWHQEQSQRGVLLQQHGSSISIASHPRFAPQIRHFLRLDREARLTPASLETLAIIAYQQPVTRAEIEGVRGVDASAVLATLHHRGLIDAVGRLNTVGSPIQYGTTAEFLRVFSLRSLADLPPLGQVDGRDLQAALEATIASVAEEADTEPGPPPH